MFTFGSDILVGWRRGGLLARGWFFLVCVRRLCCARRTLFACAGLALVAVLVGAVLVARGAGRGCWLWRCGEAGEGGFPLAFTCSGREAGGGPVVVLGQAGVRRVAGRRR
jgi:hypothetical protein